MSDSSQGLSALLSSKPCPPNYTEFFSARGRKLKHEQIRVLTKKFMLASMSSSPQTKPITPLAPGLPHPDTLPFTTAEFRMKDGSTLRLDEKETATATTYNTSEGYLPLRNWLTGFHKEEHAPGFWGGRNSSCETADVDGGIGDFNIAIVSGITEGMRIAIDVLLDPEDTVLVETEVFCSTYALLGMTCLTEAVEHDDQGMLVESLEDVLSNWTQRYPQRKFPKVLHAITAGNNPTGYTWSEERLVDIYWLCRKYNLLVLEDGAYYFLQFEQRVPSFQSVDVDGRVLRMDTFSKTIGGGFRLGWVTGPGALVEKVQMGIQYMCLHPNTFGQVVVCKILQRWGKDGFKEKVREIGKFYQRRAKVLSEAAARHLGDLCTWNVPKAGMFLWVKVKGIEDSTEVAEALFDKHKVAVLPGSLFTTKSGTSPALRVSYSIADEKAIDDALMKMAEVIREHISK